MSAQHLEHTLFAVPAKIDGDTFSFEHDSVRLTGQLLAVYELMRDGKYRTLRQIADAVGGSEGGVSARLRDFRKDRYGNKRVEKRAVPGRRGLYEYALLLNGEPNGNLGCGSRDDACRSTRDER